MLKVFILFYLYLFIFFFISLISFYSRCFWPHHRLRFPVTVTPQQNNVICPSQAWRNPAVKSSSWDMIRNGCSMRHNLTLTTRSSPSMGKSRHRSVEWRKNWCHHKGKGDGSKHGGGTSEFRIWVVHIPLTCTSGILMATSYGGDTHEWGGAIAPTNFFYFLLKYACRERYIYISFFFCLINWEREDNWSLRIETYPNLISTCL